MSEIYIELDTILSEPKENVSVVIKINELMAKACETNQSIENFGEHEIVKIIREDVENIKRKEFSWEKEFADSKTLHRKLFLTFFNRINSQFFFEAIDAKIFKQIFTLPVIKLYMDNPNYTFGKKVYDETLRVHTQLLLAFLNLHLKYDFRYRAKIDTMKISTMDPFFRQKIRNANKNDPIIKEKYFCQSFSLKQFIKSLMENYFPNVGWRWIGAGHQAHVKTLEIIVHTLELGLWEANEIRELMRDIYSKADTLRKLENFCKNDARNLSIVMKNEMVTQLSLCRQHIGFIMIQCLTIINDYAFLSSIPFIDYSLGEFIVDKNSEE